MYILNVDFCLNANVVYVHTGVNESTVEGSEDDDTDHGRGPLKFKASPRKPPPELTTVQRPLSLEQRATDAAICLTSLSKQPPHHGEQSNHRGEAPALMCLMGRGAEQDYFVG